MRAAVSLHPCVRLATLTAFLLALNAPGSLAVPNPGRAPETWRDETKTRSSPSLSAIYTTTGRVALSLDGLGISSRAGLIQVDKPVGGTVRAAFLATASTGFTNATIPDGMLSLNALPVRWDQAIANAIGSRNYLADVTTLLAPGLDAAAPGTINVLVDEGTIGHLIDGSILAVIWDDPGEAEVRTVSLFFGAQDVDGDTFNIGLAEPARPDEPGYRLDLSLGISYGFQDPATMDQISQIDVNGARITSSAGGQDDGEPANGALLTVGGLGDSRETPADPNAPPEDYDYDDELYDLKPFVKAGTQLIQVTTLNPSRDDNVFFAGLLVSGVALVNEGIALAPVSGVAPVGVPQTVTAILQDDAGFRISGRDVSFQVISGPDAGFMATIPTDVNGEAHLTLPGSQPGVDEVRGAFLSGAGAVVVSQSVTRTWIDPEVCLSCPVAPLPETVAGDPYLIEVSFCNCGDVADTFAWTVTDQMGWLPATGDAVHLAPGDCAVATVRGVVPLKLAAADSNVFTLRVNPRSHPSRGSSCMVRMPIRPPTLAVVLARIDARVEPGGVRISWETASEQNHAFFDLYRAEAATTTFQKINPAPLTGTGHCEFLDVTARPGTTCRYRLEAVDRHGVRQLAGEAEVTLPDSGSPLRLGRNTPNPFASETTFDLELDAPTDATVEIFDLSGRRVRTLLARTLDAGTTRLGWDGRDDVGRPTPAGLYFARVAAGGVSRTLRLLFTPR